MPYEKQLEIKKKQVVECMKKYCSVPVEVADCVGAENPYNYRNKAQYRFAKVGDKVTAGFYASGTHRVIGNEACPLQPTIFGEITRTVCEFAEKYNISVYDEESGKGLLRHLYIRSGSGDNGEICVCLVINGKDFLYGERIENESYSLHCFELSLPHPKTKETLVLRAKCDFEL